MKGSRGCRRVGGVEIERNEDDGENDEDARGKE